jgi:phosphatidate phosphatase APP1
VAHKFPILLSFYGLSNSETTLVFGQLTYTPIKDLTFQEYSRKKTFRTLFRLYHTRPYANQELILVFSSGYVKTKTNSYGGFYEKATGIANNAILQKVILPGGEEVKVIEGLYPLTVTAILTDTIVVSDIDDTLLHSYIYKKIRKLRTMMFTTMEKRQAVSNMQELIRNFTLQGASPIYLSNSEQNLHPMIYRFLIHNKFPHGPLFLKQLRSLWHLIMNIKFPLKNIHKTQTLEELIELFPDKKFILMGDNTQHDLSIYLSLAENHAKNIRYIIIRKVVDKSQDEKLIASAKEKLAGQKLLIHYSDHFPEPFQI